MTFVFKPKLRDLASESNDAPYVVRMEAFHNGITYIWDSRVASLEEIERSGTNRIVAIGNKHEDIIRVDGTLNARVFVATQFEERVFIIAESLQDAYEGSEPYFIGGSDDWDIVEVRLTRVELL